MIQPGTGCGKVVTEGFLKEVKVSELSYANPGRQLARRKWGETGGKNTEVEGLCKPRETPVSFPGSGRETLSPFCWLWFMFKMESIVAPGLLSPT